MRGKEDKILVEIAAYKEPELLNTVKSALLQADFPKRIYFSICYQWDDLTIYKKLKKYKNCKLIYLKESETKGLCYARYLCQKQISDEKYIYQIDAHMRFVKHWDTKLIEQLESLNDEKAIISFYPAFCTEEMMTKPLNDSIYDNPTDGGALYAEGFQENSYFIKPRGLALKSDDERATKKNALIAGGNFFTYSRAHQEVLNDPYMYFTGDELAMSIRLYTYGWNVYNSGAGYIYHQYERKNQEFPQVPNAIANEQTRLKTLLGIAGKMEDLGEFGLGNVRTLEEYEEFSGIDFKNKIIYMNAETGDFENKEYKNKLSFFSIKDIEKRKMLNKKETIEVLIVDMFNEYQECIESALKKAINKENVKFIIGTKSTIKESINYKEEKNIKNIIYADNNSSYSEILSAISKKVGDGYVLIVDSSVRFIDGWDEYLCKNIKECGEKSALTSWVYYVADKTKVEDSKCYINVIKEFDSFYNFLPTLRYNEQINLSKRKSPYQTPFISDGFLFCHSNIIKQIEIDPNITYNEFKYLYSLRLWTNNINIYYPTISFFIRTKDESLLNNDVQNMDIVCGVSRNRCVYYNILMGDYPYDIGNKRPIWTFYDSINVPYDSEEYIVKGD